MKIKSYNFILGNGKDIEEDTCTALSLPRIIDKFIGEDYKMLAVVKRTSKQYRKIDMNKVEKNKFYNSKYTSFYKKYKDGKVNEKEYKEIIETLKALKKECQTKEEYERKFFEYQNKKH